MMLRIVMAVLLFSLGGAGRAAPPPEDPGKVQVMVLGTFHFHNPNADTAQFKGINVLEERRQDEIAEVVDSLSAFKPTKIALEIRRTQGEAASKLADQYARYRSGTYELTSNEVHQLGFRLANRFDHDRVYPVDYGVGLDIPQLMEYSAAKDPEFAGWFGNYIAHAENLIDTTLAERTIGGSLRWMNQADTLALAQSGYMKMASVGAGDTYIGGDVAGQWYLRNLKIFGNLADISEPGDRVILIVGQGHAPILRQFVSDHPEMELVEPNAYLK